MLQPFIRYSISKKNLIMMLLTMLQQNKLRDAL